MAKTQTLPSPSQPKGLRSFGWFLLYFCAVIAGGGLLGAWLAKAGLAMDTGFWHELCADNPARIVRRVQTVLAVLLAPWMLRRIGWRGFRDLGWTAGGAPDRRWRDAGWAALTGAAIVCGLYLLSLEAGARTARPLTPAAFALSVAGGILLTGVGVGVIEETLTRGVLYRSMARAWTPWTGALVSSGLFAAAHFMKATRESFAGSAWEVFVSSWVDGFAKPDIPYKFLTLFLFGILLCRLVRHRGDIWAAAGLHAGAVGVMRVVGQNSDANFSYPLNPWISRNAKFDDSLLLSLLLLGMILVLELVHAGRRGQP